MYDDNDDDNDNVRCLADGGTDESDDDPFGEAMDAAESAAADDETGERASEDVDSFDLEAFLETVSEGEKTKMLSIRVTPEMHRLWRELREDPSVEVDVPESIRNHIETLAHRHPTAAERAGRKLAIERELQ